MNGVIRYIKTRNKQWDLIRAIGIIFVVWGHNFQPPYIFYPAFYFQLSLFFFVSGYFFKPQLTFKDKFTYFLKKTRNQLLPYFLLSILFGLFTMWLKTIGINLGLDLNFETLFIAPFGRGDQFLLYLAAWFLFNLYFIGIFADIFFQKNKIINFTLIILGFFLMLFLLSINNTPGQPTWIIFLSRSVFGFVFFGLGYMFHIYENQIQKFLILPASALCLYLIIYFLQTYFGNINYSILFGTVSNNIVIVPVITSLCIILLVYIISYHGYKLFNPNSFIFLIGEYSFFIMVWHLFFFFLVNVIFYNLGLIPFSALSDVYYKYDVEKLWLTYQIPAIIGPLLIIWGYKVTKHKILNLVSNNWTKIK